MRNPNPTKHTNLELDTVTTFHPKSGFFFEDNETVIKMIIKSRSPTMRHVSRTHRVALDWLFDPEDSKSTSVGPLCIFGTHKFVAGKTAA